MRARAIAIGLALLASVGVDAHADSRVALGYVAPAECPTAAEIERALATRAVTVDPGAALGARMTIVKKGSALEGTITTTTGVTRTIVERGCASLAEALVVVLAIAVLDAPSEPLPLGPTAVTIPPNVFAEPRVPRGGFAVGAAVAFASHVAPRIAVGGSAFAELVPWRSGVVELSLRVAVEALSVGAIDVDAATQAAQASFTWLGGRFDVGALRLRAARAEVRFGATLGVGGLRAQGLEVRDPRTVWAPLADVGPFVRGRYVVGPVAVELGAALVVPLVRARFLLAPNESLVFSVPPVGVFFEAGLSLGRDFL